MSALTGPEVGVATQTFSGAPVVEPTLSYPTMLIQSCLLQDKKNECVFNVLNGSEAGQGQDTPITSLSCSSRTPIHQGPPEAYWKSTSNATSTWTHQKVHNDVHNIPPHPHHTDTTHFLWGWRKSTPLNPPLVL